jgi:hypothetical protein
MKPEHLAEPLQFWQVKSGEELNQLYIFTLTLVIGTLLLINSPGVLTYVTQPPHKGLAKEIRQAKHLKGFALNDYSEIKLHPGQDREITASNGEPSGRHCMQHFVRSHLRRLPDRYTLVRPHWRGDPAFGIKQSHYTVETPPCRPA